MTAIDRKKGRLRLVLLAALGLGAFSALLSGTLVAVADAPIRSIFMN
jgi:hypothetical protein